jgi:uncharacterized membrane protein
LRITANPQSLPSPVGSAHDKLKASDAQILLQIFYIMKSTNKIERASFKLTHFIGTPTSVILHTLLFIGIFLLHWLKFSIDQILLILTTAVSLEAIYLSIFIQMSLNRTTESLEDVSEDVEEIAKDVDELQEDVEGIEGNVQEIAKDVEEIDRDVDEIAKDIDEIQEDQEDEVKSDNASQIMISKIEKQMQIIMDELNTLKQK